MNPFWDLKRYVGNFERGLEEIWYNFLSGAQPRHIFVEEEDEEEDF
jgi:hypothetical protein